MGMTTKTATFAISAIAFTTLMACEGGRGYSLTSTPRQTGSTVQPISLPSATGSSSGSPRLTDEVIGDSLAYANDKRAQRGFSALKDIPTVGTVAQNHTINMYDSSEIGRYETPGLPGDTGKVSSIVVVAADVVALSAGASVKSQDLAADRTKQTVAAIRSAPNLPATATTSNGVNAIELCRDTALDQSDAETRTSLIGEIGSCVGPVMRLMFANAPAFDARSPGASSHSAPVGTPYCDLFHHGTARVALFGLSEPFTGTGSWFQEGMSRTISQLSMTGKAPALAELNRSTPYGAARRRFTKDSLIRNFTSMPDISGGADRSVGSTVTL
jgi:hypothetical protein